MLAFEFSLLVLWEKKSFFRVNNPGQSESRSYQTKLILSIIHRVWSVVINSYVIDSRFVELIVSIWISHEANIMAKGTHIAQLYIDPNVYTLSSSVKPVHTHLCTASMNWTVTCIKQCRWVISKDSGGSSVTNIAAEKAVVNKSRFDEGLKRHRCQTKSL